jgi:hypothetical protein
MGVLNSVSSIVGNFTLYVSCRFPVHFLVAVWYILDVTTPRSNAGFKVLSLVLWYVVGRVLPAVPLKGLEPLAQRHSIIHPKTPECLFAAAVFGYARRKCCETVEREGLWRYVCKYSATAKCEFTGFRSGAVEVSVLLGYVPRHWMIGAPTFETSVVLSSKVACPLKLRPLQCLKTSGTNHPLTRRHIPEERRLQLHWYD